MFALIFLCLLLCWGYVLNQIFLPDLPGLLRWRGERPYLLQEAPGYLGLVRGPLILLLAFWPSAPAIYLLYSLYARILCKPEDLALPLAAGSWALLISGHCLYYFVRRRRPLRPALWNLRPRDIRAQLPLLFFVLMLVACIWLLCYYPLSQRGSVLYSGSSVVSDYSAHIGLISSFSRGLNPYPSSYPFFAGAGLRYHFYFYFLTAVFDRLGLGLVGALNLCSALGLAAFLSLLACCIWKLCARRNWSLLLAPPLLLWHPSLRFWDFFQDYVQGKVQAPSLWRALVDNRLYVGHGPHDDWGLWNLNVWANQRHFAWGLACSLAVILLISPWLRRSSGRLGLSARWRGPRAWRLPPERGDLTVEGHKNRPLPVLFLLLLLAPFWHGSVLFTLLLCLALVWFYLRDKGPLLLLGLSTALATLAQTKIFAAGSSEIQLEALKLRWHWGFLLEQPNLAQVLTYLLATLGLVLPAFFLLPFLQRRRSLALLAGLSALPLLLTFTLSLTPDITVNHKWLLVARIWLLPFWAALLVRLWSAGSWAKLDRVPQRLGRLILRALALILLLASCFTGLLDQQAYLYKNGPEQRFGLDTSSSLTKFLQSRSEPQAVFLTPSWFYHAFFYSGRLSFQGHAYFPWSAGYDTYSRDSMARTLYAGCNRDMQNFKQLIERWNIRYICVDDSLRQELGEKLDEDFFRQNLRLVAEFPDQGNLRIYSLSPAAK